MAFVDTGNRAILDSGCGTRPPDVTLAEACKAGDVLGYSAGWKRALATAGSVIQGKLIALTAGKAGERVKVAKSPTVNGYTGAAPGSPVYVAEGTDNGKITQTVPTTTADATTVVGIALSDTEVLFFLNSRVDSVV